MTKKEKFVGNVAGYAGVALLIVAFVFGMFSLYENFSFRGDAFVMLAICALFATCKDVYREFRTKENTEWEKEKQKNKRIITVVATYDISSLQGCKLTPAENVKQVIQEKMEDIFAEDEGYESVNVKVEDIE